MIIEKIRLRNFRNYEETVLTPHEGVNLFFGANGSEKTNLLEAIHYCALGKSHRVTGDQSTVRIGENYGSCGVSVLSRGIHRDITVRLTPNETNKKVILLEKKQIRKFSDMMGCLQCVIFSPEDLGLIREGPTIRRRYLDMMISQVNRGYFIALQQYRSGLEQRNALLKQMRINKHLDTGMLDVFEQAISGPAAIIVQTRKKVVDLISAAASETYREISGRENEIFQAEYHSAFRESDNVSDDFLRVLKQNREEDLRVGITSAGPHRDDLNLFLNRKNMKVYASQGQIRTAALSLKLAQMKTLRAISGEAPVLLLDDVMSELDKDRRMRLVKEISDYQTFITCTDETDLELKGDRRTYHVSAPEGLAVVLETNRGAVSEKLILSEPEFS